MARVFITGSTDGLGRAAAQSLLDQGHEVVLHARSKERAPSLGGLGAPVDVDTGQRTQTWLATSMDPEALVSGRYWYQQRQHRPAKEAMDVAYQDQLLAELESLTGIALP